MRAPNIFRIAVLVLSSSLCLHTCRSSSVETHLDTRRRTDTRTHTHPSASVHRRSSSSLSFTCPPAGSTTVIPTTSIEDAGGIVDLERSPDDSLCTLTLQVTSSDINENNKSEANIPVLRSYDGRDWERTAGPFSETMPLPSCNSDDSSDGVCTVDITDHLPNDDSAQLYVLTTYPPKDIGMEAEAARFLEQATFGPNRDTIQQLVESSEGDDQYLLTWVKDQVESIPMNSHREYYRKRMNPRMEYAQYFAKPGPMSACDETSQWRMFALDKRDGLRSNQTRNTKYLSFKKIANNRIGWFVEGMLRTTSDEWPSLYSETGEFKKKVEKEPYLYSFHYRDFERKSCIGCPILVTQKPVKEADGVKDGYINNPIVDLTGVIGNTQLIPYSIVDLPPILGTDDDNDDEQAMKSINNDLFETNKFFSQYNKADDEFLLRDASSIDRSQCANHPSTDIAAWKVRSKLNTSKNDEVKGKNHPETVFPPIFGKTYNERTKQYQYLLFDPKMIVLENTVENPIPDGGGLVNYETEGRVYCANAPRNYRNEDGCKYIFNI